MKSGLFFIGSAVIAILSLSAGALYGQVAGPGRRGVPTPPAANATGNPFAGQAAGAFAIGDAIQIQAADGSWIAGTVRNYDASAGKYEVVLANSMTGWAPASALRKAAAPGQNPFAQPAPPAPVVAQPAAPQMAAQPVAQAVPAICGATPACTEVADFASAITNFHVTEQGGYRVADATIRFVNKAGRPIALGYVSASALMIDDQGNRFNVMNESTIRGIGIIRGNNPDAKFIVQPGQTGDATMQLAYARGNSILGSAFELQLTIRELNPVGTSQYTLGAEYPLHFAAIGQTLISATPGAAPAGPQVPGAPAAAAPGMIAAAPVAGQPGVQPGTPGAPATGGRAARLLGGVSQLQSIPGLSGTPQAGANGQPATGRAAQIAALGSAFTPSGAQPGAGGGVAGALSQASAVIPGFSPAAASAPTAATPGAAPAIAGFTPGAAAPAVGAAPAVAAGDPCAGRQHCFNAGAFSVDVNQVAGAATPTGYVVRAHAIFHNNSGQPLALAYVASSAAASDNAGNRFGPTLNGTAEQTVGGMGTLAGNQAAASFVLAAGQSRPATFTMTRPGASGNAPGTAFNVDFTVAELVMNGAQATPGRQHRVVLANVACACGAVAKAGAPAAAPASPFNLPKRAPATKK